MIASGVAVRVATVPLIGRMGCVVELSLVDPRSPHPGRSESSYTSSPVAMGVFNVRCTFVKLELMLVLLERKVDANANISDQRVQQSRLTKRI